MPLVRPCHYDSLGVQTLCPKSGSNASGKEGMLAASGISLLPARLLYEYWVRTDKQTTLKATRSLTPLENIQ